MGTTIIPKDDGELMVNNGRSGLHLERIKPNSPVYVEQWLPLVALLCADRSHYAFCWLLIVPSTYEAHTTWSRESPGGRPRSAPRKAWPMPYEINKHMLNNLMGRSGAFSLVSDQGRLSPHTRWSQVVSCQEEL